VELLDVQQLARIDYAVEIAEVAGTSITLTTDQARFLLEHIRHLRYASNAVLRYISSHQVYDKDAAGMLQRALDGVPVAGPAE